MTSVFISTAAPRSAHSDSAQPSVLAEYVFFPFYDWLVRFYPRRWVPNLITLFGVSCTLASSLLLLSAMPTNARFIPAHVQFLPASLVREGPPTTSPLYVTELEPTMAWMSPQLLLFVCGLLNLIYCIADNTDGRLARRDRHFSVVGEYLDHGLDCVTSLLSAALVFGVAGASLSNMIISVLLIATTTLLSHTLHYERNIFIWGNRVASVDEAMIFFGVCMWAPLMMPQMGHATLPDELVDRLPLLHDAWRVALKHMKVIEIGYLFYAMAQAETIFSIVRRNANMILRVQLIFMLVNAAVLLLAVPFHDGAMEAGLVGATLGPLSYPALWIITCACSCSTIVHVPILARCAKMSRIDPLPLGGLIFVWVIFLAHPAAGTVVSVAVHVTQVLRNIGIIRRRCAPRRG